MCYFFSFLTEPESHGGKRFYFDWNYRKEHLDLDDGLDSHSMIAEYFELCEDDCNKYEYNPFNQQFVVDQLNSSVNDSVQASEWARSLDIRRIIGLLARQKIKIPFTAPSIAVTDEHISWLKERDKIYNPKYSGSILHVHIINSISRDLCNQVGTSVANEVESSITTSVRAFIKKKIDNAIHFSNGLIMSSETYRTSISAIAAIYSAYPFDIDYKYEFLPCWRLLHCGIVPIYFDGTWRLYSGENVEMIYEWTPEDTK